MTRQVVIGVDAGTTAVKAVAFDLRGRELGEGHRRLPISFGDFGEAECDMDAIWEATATCLRDVTALLVDDEVLAVGVTGQGDGLWLVDAERRPIGDAPCWMDGRAAGRAAAWNADGRAQAVLDTIGTATFSGLTPVLFAELSEVNPDRIARADTFLYCKDWIRFQLTGEIATDYTDASRAMLDIRSLQYSRPLASHLGIERLVDLMPPVTSSETLAGYVTSQASEQTGLREGTPVAVGLLDVSACGLGLGAVNDGDGWVILGTTACVGALLPEAGARRSQESMVIATGRGTQAVEFLVPASSVPNLEWAKQTLGIADRGHEACEKLAEQAGPGSGGVLYLPYGAPLGERAPFIDSNASASWVGVGYATTQGELLRAVFEGIAFALAESIETLGLTGDIVVSGGGARSALLCRLIADTLQQSVVRQELAEAGALGAAITALVASGDYVSLQSGVDQTRPATSRFVPNPALAKAYAEAREYFVKTRAALRPVWADLRHFRTSITESKGISNG